VLYSQASRAKNTLLIKIEFRQNASMQGRVIGKITSQKYICFRSALELMRMIKEIAMKAERSYR
ncbi:MAG TPA: tungsten formylmethanofuran dehydrogenase, partial [Lachnoclostridium sp.]|nr:tungsten formylmethanofuran dehydrogenase [Lachnoclostridium sp.]